MIRTSGTNAKTISTKTVDNRGCNNQLNLSSFIIQLEDGLWEKENMSINTFVFHSLYKVTKTAFSPYRFTDFVCPGDILCISVTAIRIGTWPPKVETKLLKAIIDLSFIEFLAYTAQSPSWGSLGLHMPVYKRKALREF